MKKVIGMFCVIGLTFALVVGTQVYASSSIEDNINAVQQSRTITYSTDYKGNVVPPYTHPYDNGVWSGTLYRIAYQFDGVRTLVTYRGTVYCSGSCPI